jgi:altronate dehydratase
MRARNFNDITTGANSNYAAAPGYDLVTGRGTPIAYRVIPALASFTPTTTAATAKLARAMDVASPAVVTGSAKRRESALAGLFSTQEIP